MQVTAQREISASVLATNLAALSVKNPRLATALQEDDASSSAQPLPGRDGSPTFAWTTPDGRRQWLGRTSMPTISAPALIEAFDPGAGNVLLHSFGHGEEVVRLLDKILPYQAIFIIEPHAWQLRLALHLNDFTQAILAGRLCLFAGDEAWTDMAEFLAINRGYLIPERILARPWFDRAFTHELIQMLTELGQSTAKRRAIMPPTAQRPPTTGESNDHCLAIISNVPLPRVRQLAADIAESAPAIGWSSMRFVLDDPAWVNPSIVEEALKSGNCEPILLLDVVPSALAYKLPDRPSAILVTHDNALPAEWIRQVPPQCMLAVQSQSQLAQAVETGIQRGRIMLSPPAVPDLHALTKAVTQPDHVAVVADLHDLTPESVGLHLASHQHLWIAAIDQLRNQIDKWDGTNLALLLAAAEEKLGMKLRSPEVRAGLIERMEKILWPSLIAEVVVKTVATAGFRIALFGEGWNRRAEFSEMHRGPWPPRAEAKWDRIGFVVFATDDSSVRSGALWAGARKLPAVRYTHHDSNGAKGSTFDTASNIMGREFHSANELKTTLEAFQSRPGEFLNHAQAARMEILEKHTWSRRLKDLLSALGQYSGSTV